jgi:Cys-rich repeat protein
MASWRRHLFFLLCLVSYLPACGNDTVTDGGVQCTRNEECGVGEYCKNGICTPYQTCSSDEDCSQGEICHLGVCEPGSRPDAGDGSDAGDGGEEQNDGGDPAADQPEPRPKITLAGDVIVHEDQQGKT